MIKRVKPIIVSANECVYLMLNLMKSDVTACQDSILSYLDAQLYLGHNISYKFIMSVLKLVKKVRPRKKYVWFRLPDLP